MDNLHSILKNIQSRDTRDLSQDDINKMLLEVIDIALYEDGNAKGLEVALKAIAKLGEGVEVTALTDMDQELKNRLPADVLRVVEGKK
tara:strand:- start:1144 stop:1407 length:264 start_codon:yes stop_codon:yes gene_type:complete